MSPARLKPAEPTVEPELYQYKPGDRTWCSVSRQWVIADGYVPPEPPPLRVRRLKREDDESTPLTEKECTCCERTLPLIAFYEYERGRCGVTARCKECLRFQASKRYRSPEGKAAMLAASARYRASELGKSTRRAAQMRKPARTSAVRVGAIEPLSRLFELAQKC